MTDPLPTLHCRLTDASLSQIEAWVADPRGLQSPTPNTYDLDALARWVAQWPTPLRCVVWLAPSMSLELTATVPAMSTSQLRSRVPYAIEDSLIDDIEEEHVALGTTSALPDGQQQLPLRVIKRAALETLLQSLREQAGLTPDAVHAEADALPPKPGDLQLWIEQDQVRLRHPDGRWLVTSPDQLETTLRWWTPQGTGELGLWVIARRSDRARWEPQISALTGFSAVRWQLTDPGPLCWLVNRLPSDSAINLLQGEFAPSGPKWIWAHWKWPVGWAAAIAILLLGLDVSYGARQAQQEAALDQALSGWRTMVAQAPRESVEPLTALSAGLGLAGALQNVWPEVELQALTLDETGVTLSLATRSDPLDPSVSPAGSPKLPEPPAALINHWAATLAPFGLSAPRLSRSDTGWQLSVQRGAP